MQLAEDWEGLIAIVEKEIEPCKNFNEPNDCDHYLTPKLSVLYGGSAVTRALPTNLVQRRIVFRIRSCVKSYARSLSMWSTCSRWCCYYVAWSIRRSSSLRPWPRLGLRVALPMWGSGLITMSYFSRISLLSLLSSQFGEQWWIQGESFPFLPFSAESRPECSWQDLYIFYGLNPDAHVPNGSHRHNFSQSRSEQWN